MTKIIEASDDGVRRIVTIRTDRCDEFVIDADAAACAVADLLSNLDNEKRGGWSLRLPWFIKELDRLRQNVLTTAHEDGGRRDVAHCDEGRAAAKRR